MTILERREKVQAIKNSVANVLRGGASAIVALLLPPFLTRSMSQEAFGAWSLVLQLAGYMGFLDFGVQVAVSRFVARANERNDAEERDAFINAALLVLLITAGVGWLLSLIAAAMFHSIFPEMHPELVGQAQAALLLVAASLCVNLPASVFSGIFVGLRRNEIPAALGAVPKICGGLGIVVLARNGAGLTSMGACLAASNLLSAILQFGVSRWLLPQVRLGFRYASRAVMRQLLVYCASLSVWTFGMLFVVGLDLAIVGVVDFHSVAFYALAATLVSLFTGLYNAVFSVLMPIGAALQARNESSALGDLLIASTRYGTVLLLLISVPLLALTRPVLSLWVASEYVDATVPLIRILVVANIVRQIGNPYANLLLGIGEQFKVVLSPIAEAVVNLTASIILGLRYGATGVAVGTLLGSSVALLGHWFYNMPRTHVIRFRRTRYFVEGLAVPILMFGPSLFCWILTSLLPLSARVALLIFCIVFMGNVVMIGATFRFGWVRSPASIRPEATPVGSDTPAES